MTYKYNFISNRIPINNIIISVYDKRGLDIFVNGLLQINPHINFLSTGGTYVILDEILEKELGAAKKWRLMDVEEYTGLKEMDGGLVKTLHPKIFAAILADSHNSLHNSYLKDYLSNAVPLDMVVVNLAPFTDITKMMFSSFEDARGYIDIGGSAMLRAAAKNFPRCLAISNPKDYVQVLSDIKNNDGCSLFDQRISFAKSAFLTTAKYDEYIFDYMSDRNFSYEDYMGDLDFSL